MNLQTLSTAFVSIIAIWAAWCVLSHKVRDGIVGKIIYAAIAVSGFAIATRGETVLLSPSAAGVTFHGALALAGVRHWCVANHWPRVKAWLCRHLNCERCLHCDKAPGGIERRKQ